HSLLIRQYELTPNGIDFEEVERMRTELGSAITELMSKEDTDSPVYTFLNALAPPINGSATNGSAPTAAAPVATTRAATVAAAPAMPDRPPAPAPAAAETQDDLSADLLIEAIAARDRGDFTKAKGMLSKLLPRRP